MTIEDKLRDLIISKYGSISNFSREIGMANSTLATIMKNGVKKANVTNIIKICKSLEISTDELAKNRIVPVSNDSKNEFKIRELTDIFELYKLNFRNYKRYTVYGYELNRDDADLFLDAMELALEFIKRKKEREKNK